MKNLNKLVSIDGHTINIDLGNHNVVAIRQIANRSSQSFVDFGMHPLADAICQFLIQRAPVWPSGTLLGYCHAFVRLLEFCKRSSSEELTAETFAAFTSWLKSVKSKRNGYAFVEQTRRCYGCFVLKLMEWLVEQDEILPREVYLARGRHQRAFRGSSARQLELMRATAVSPDEYVRLIKAIRLEYEECRALLNASGPDQIDYDSTFPLLPFSLLLGTELALRSVEFNHLRVSDLNADRLLLNPPNKEPSEVRLTPGLLATLELAQKWMLRFRKRPSRNDPLLVVPAKRGRKANCVQFDSRLLLRSLRKFYEKYFAMLESDGLPTLYRIAEEDESTLLPFRLSFRRIRSASITQAARYESNVEAVMQFARHKCLDTTMKHYIHETHKQWMNNVALCLAPSAELLRIALENRIADQSEERTAKASIASVPGGHCAQALSGDLSCRRAIDCRLCQFFRIHVSKRDFFVKELEEGLARAETLQRDEGLTREAQNLRQFAALNQAIISRIDEYVFQS